MNGLKGLTRSIHLFGINAQRSAKRGGWKKRYICSLWHWFQPINSTENIRCCSLMLIKTLSLCSWHPTQERNPQRSDFYIKSLITWTKLFLASTLGFQHLKHWNKFTTSEFIIPLRNTFHSSSVRNNLVLVVKGGVGLGLMCLLWGDGKDFSVLFLKKFCPLPILSTTRHIPFFSVLLSKLNS